jgi:hypothetical protein
MQLVLWWRAWRSTRSTGEFSPPIVGARPLLTETQDPSDEHCLMRASKFNRAISTGKLHALLRFHTRPINVVVFHGSQGSSSFEVGFPLRCFQRLSRPYIATLLCRWRDNRSTRGTSIPVLSYWGQILSILLHPRQIGTELSHDVLNPAHVPL